MDAPRYLHALVTRQEDAERPQCGSSSDIADYNLGLHVFALFLVMVCGTSACCFPSVAKAYPRLAISRHALFISRHFGTGVLIALAFCHLLPTAFENLWNECLPYAWTEGYGAMPGLIAMVAALSVALVEMAFALTGSRHVHAAERELRGTRQERQEARKAASTDERRGSHAQEGKVQPSTAQYCANGDECDADLICPCDTPGPDTDSRKESMSSHGIVEAQSSKILFEQREQRKILQCLLLEAGILFHSVFIGLSISLSTGTTFIALMVAISFHQIFEGLALGARIAAIDKFEFSSSKPWVMSLAYGLTCPLGQAIGLGLRNAYDPEGMTALLVVGVANAISAGMILYAGLVQLLGEDLLSESSYSTLSPRSRLEATASVVLGCAIMAMIAVWA